MKYLTIIILGLVIASFFIVIDIRERTGEDEEEKHLEDVYKLQEEAKQRVIEREEEQRTNSLILQYELAYYTTGDPQYKQVANYLRG